MIDKEQKIIAFPHASSENAKSVDSTATQTNDPDMTDKIDAAVRDQIKDDEEKLLAIELPTALAEREVKLFFFSYSYRPLQYRGFYYFYVRWISHLPCLSHSAKAQFYSEPHAFFIHCALPPFSVLRAGL